MFRCCLIAAAVACSTSVNLRAADPPSPMIAVSDWLTAAALPSLPPESKLAVLIQNDQDDYQTVNSRALAMRHATPVVYLGGSESMLSQMFRQRLIAHGAKSVDLRTTRPRAFRPADSVREYGISNFVYRRGRPFHPKRLTDALDADMEAGLFTGVLRSKGLMWITSRHDWAYDWSQAGCSIRMGPAGFWWAAAPQNLWPDDEQSIAQIESKLMGEYGDRHQELVFIGNAMDPERIIEILAITTVHVACK